MLPDDQKIDPLLLYRDYQSGITEFDRAPIARPQADRVFECPGHWDRDLGGHPGQVWPERAHAEDFLREVQERRGA